LETELETFNAKKSFLFSLRITLPTFIGSIFTQAAWAASGTQLLYLKTDRGTQLVNADKKRATNWYENWHVTWRGQHTFVTTARNCSYKELTNCCFYLNISIKL